MTQSGGGEPEPVAVHTLVCFINNSGTLKRTFLAVWWIVAENPPNVNGNGKPSALTKPGGGSIVCTPERKNVAICPGATPIQLFGPIYPEPTTAKRDCAERALERQMRKRQKKMTTRFRERMTRTS